MKVTCSRSGSFLMPQSHSDNRCGSETTTRFFYTITLTIDHANLDPHGFVVENTSIQKYFNHRYLTETNPGSCEMIAIETAHHFSSILAERTEPSDYSDDASVEVFITADPTRSVGITATLTNGDEEWGNPFVHPTTPKLSELPPSDVWVTATIPISTGTATYMGYVDHEDDPCDEF